MNLTSSEAPIQEVLTVGPPLRIVGATSYAVLSLSSVVMNVLLAMVLIRDHKKFKKFAFYTIVWQNIVVDQLTQLIQFIIAIPITYVGAPIYGKSWWLHGFGLFDTIAYNGTLYFAFLMTLNRFTVFVCPWLNKKLFERPGIYVSIGAAWAWVFVYVASLNILGCYKGFSDTGFYYYHDCGNPQAVTAHTILNLHGYSSTYLPVVMIAAYIFIYLYVKITSKLLNSNNTSSDSNKKEYKILIQSFLICGFLEVQNLAFKFFPFLGLGGQWNFVINFIQNDISILNNTINPIVLFIFNSEIRLSLKKIFRMFKKEETKVAYVSSTPRMSINVHSFSSNLRRLS